MTRLNALTIIIAVVLIGSAASVWADIYKYVDEDGTVHYVDRPTGAESEERVTVATATSQPRARDTSEQPDWRERRQQRLDDRAERAKERADAAERAEICEKYRARLVTYSDDRRLFRLDENGERVYLSAEEIAEAREQVQRQIDENCG